MKKLFVISFNIFLFLGLISIIQAQDTTITYTFRNGQVTGTTTKYYEFDIMVQCDISGTRLGDTQVYFNYNSLGFGQNIHGNSKLTVSKGSVITGTYYASPIIQDRTTSKVSIAVEYGDAFGGESGANVLPTSATQWAHIKIEIQNQSETAGLTFDHA
ncbi:MAG: hypothetical protein R6V04_01550, partial [bacterium]